MRVYRDNCSLQRPLDDKSQLRVRLEAEAILSVLDLVKVGRIELVSSDVLAFEIGRNPHLMRQEFAIETVSAASTYIPLSRMVEGRAQELTK